MRKSSSCVNVSYSLPGGVLASRLLQRRRALIFWLILCTSTGSGNFWVPVLRNAGEFYIKQELYNIDMMCLEERMEARSTLASWLAPVVTGIQNHASSDTF